MQRIWSYLLLAGITAWVIYPAQAHADWWWPFGSDEEYEVKIEGVDEDMQAWLKELALDEPITAEEPLSDEDLKQEANYLASKIKKALEAKGYMQSRAKAEIETKEEERVVRVEAKPGPRYSLSNVRLDWQGSPLQPVELKQLRSKKDDPVDMAAIEEDAITLKLLIGKDACLLSLEVAPKLRLYGRAQEAELVFEVTHGPRADFGATTVTGNTRVEESYVRRAIAWEEGDCFDAAKLDKTHIKLIESQLFASVEVNPAEKVNMNGRVPITIKLSERVPRTVSAGVNYSTSEGIGVDLGWEHRNFFGEAEKFNADLTLAQREQSIKNTLRIPSFLREDQVLALSSSLRNEDTDSYKAQIFDGSALIERTLSSTVNAGLGLGYTISHTEDAVTGENNYALLSVPSFITYDTRDNLLDAKDGFMFRLDATPYTETIGDGGQFLKLLGTGYGYFSSETVKMKPTLALRLAVGSIVGSKGDNVPADIRFYAGGGGSVRGYEYESLSPYVGGEPAGGASLIESSAELRLRFTEEIGGVIFTDAGNAFAASVPEAERLFYSVGVGARYYSAVGPLRLDVAVPMNGGGIGEKSYKIYVSLGQSF